MIIPSWTMWQAVVFHAVLFCIGAAILEVIEFYAA